MSLVGSLKATPTLQMPFVSQTTPKMHHLALKSLSSCAFPFVFKTKFRIRAVEERQTEHQLPHIPQILFVLILIFKHPWQNGHYTHFFYKNLKFFSEARTQFEPQTILKMFLFFPTIQPRV